MNDVYFHLECRVRLESNFTLWKGLLSFKCPPKEKYPNIIKVYTIKPFNMVPPVKTFSHPDFFLIYIRQLELATDKIFLVKKEAILSNDKEIAECFNSKEIGK